MEAPATIFLQTLTHFKIKFGLNGDNTFPGTSFYTDLITVFNSATYTIPARDDRNLVFHSCWHYFWLWWIQIARYSAEFPNQYSSSWELLEAQIPRQEKSLPAIQVLFHPPLQHHLAGFWFWCHTRNHLFGPTNFYWKRIGSFPKSGFRQDHFKMKEQIFTKRNYLITNLKGQNLLSGETNKSLESIDIRMLPAGNYFLEVSEEDQQFRTSFLKH